MNFDKIRRIVSGKKSRLADDEIGVDLDLSYITDRIIIMGYPASGIESLYRNRRKDVRKWLEARHGKNYKIYNFCPRRENEYEASYFHNQVARFPFPDHHAPPISMIPLFVHDITCFLDASADNVAVIHCKAGKGRSGTMTVCYLMTLAQLPQPPRFKDLYIKSLQQLDPSNAAPALDSSASLSTAHRHLAVHLAHQLPPISIEKLSINPLAASTPRSDMQEGNNNSTGDGGHSSPKSRISDSFIIRDPQVSQQSEEPAGSSVEEPSPARAPEHLERPTVASLSSDQPPPPNMPKCHRTPQVHEHGVIPGKTTPPQAELVCEIADDVLNPHSTHQPQAVDFSASGLLTLHNPVSDVKLMKDMAEKILSLFQYHTSRRMADPISVPYGISIPSQRRSIRYWGDILLGKDPRQPTNPSNTEVKVKNRVQIKWIKVYVPETVRYAKVFTSRSKIAVQLARYSDSFAQDLRAREMALLKSGFYPIVQPALDDTHGKTLESSTQPGAKPGRLFRQHNDDMWEDRENMISAFASFGQDKRILRKAKSLVTEKTPKGPERPAVNQRNRSSTETERPPGSRASILTDFTTGTSTTGSLIDIDDSQLEETFIDHSDNSDQDHETEDPAVCRYLTPVRLYDFPASAATGEGPVQYKKIKGGKSIGEAGGVSIDAHREILLRIVLGSTGKNHANLLPDATLLGYLWFIPSFHEPSFGTFSPTSKLVKEVNQSEPESPPLVVTTFPKEEIDFLNANVTKVEVAWTRVD